MRGKIGQAVQTLLFWNIDDGPGAVSVSCVSQEHSFLPGFLRRQNTLESFGRADQEEWKKKKGFFFVMLYKCKQVVVISFMQGHTNCKNTH